MKLTKKDQENVDKQMEKEAEIRRRTQEVQPYVMESNVPLFFLHFICI